MVELPDDSHATSLGAAELRRSALWSGGIALVGAAAALGVYAFQPLSALLAVAAGAAALALGCLAALALIGRAGVPTAIIAIATGYWLMALSLSGAGSALLAAAALAALTPLVVALPHLGTADVTRLCVGGVAVVLVSALAAMHVPFPELVAFPPSSAADLGGAALAFLAALVALSAWSSRRTLDAASDPDEAELEWSRRALVRARDDVMAASRARSAFLEKMSHELRTPLNAVIGYTEMLHEEAEKERDDRYLPDLRRILQASRRLMSSIDDIIDLSMIEGGVMELSHRSFDVKGLLREIASAVEADLERNANRFEVELDRSLGEMRCDRKKVRQILHNLLSNAARFTEAGTVRLEVHRLLEDGREWLHFLVGDTGAGMAPEQIRAIYEEFAQVDPSLPHSLAGTGLGLPLSRRYCEMLGGTLEVSSEPGRGSELEVRLPAEPLEGDGSPPQTG